MAAVTKWCPKVVYNAIPLVFTFPMRPWNPGTRGEGGYRISGAGIPNGYEQRRDETSAHTLRFYEAQWLAVRAWLVWAQRNPATPFTFQFDQDDAGTIYTVWLHEPRMGTIIQPPRTDYLAMMEQNIVIRAVNRQPIHVLGWSNLPNIAASVEVTETLSLRV